MHRAIRYSLIFLGIYFSSLADATSKVPKLSEENQCQLTFGLVEWRPGQYLDDDGKFSGAQVDLINDITGQLGCTVEYRPSTWSDTLTKIKSGEIDFAGNATLVDDRRNFAHFSAPYHQDVFLFYVKNKNLKRFSASNVEELMRTDFRLGLTKNFIYGPALNAWLNHPQYRQNISFENSSQINMTRLENDQIDGLLEDPFVIAYMRRKKLIEMDIAPLPIQQLGLDSRFIFSKKTVSAEFVARFDNLLKAKIKSPDFSKVWYIPQRNQ